MKCLKSFGKIDHKIPYRMIRKINFMDLILSFCIEISLLGKRKNKVRKREKWIFTPIYTNLIVLPKILA